jgi:anti-sigma factor RsiW
MMPQWRPGLPRDGDPSGHDEYAMWDAAYVLGSLSSVGRQEFEAHLAVCPLCPSAIGELSGVPALLSQLDRDVLVAIDEANLGGGEPLPPDELLPTLLAKVNGRLGPPQPRC